MGSSSSRSLQPRTPGTTEGYRTEYSQTINTRGKSRLICFCKPFFKRLTNLENYLNEIIVLKSGSNVASGVYRPFKCFQNETPSTNFERLLANLELISSSCSKGTFKSFIGDFNIHLDNFNCSMSRKLGDWSDLWNLTQIVDFNTRSRMVDHVLQVSMIDLIFTDHVSLITHGEFTDFSDHVIVFCKDRSYVQEKQTKSTITYLDWRKYRPSEVRTLFQKFISGFNCNLRTPEQINDAMSSAIVKTLNSIVPKRQTTIHGINSVINPIIQNLKNRKSRIYKKWSRDKTEHNWLSLKEVSKHLNKEIRKERSKTLNISLNKSSREFWSTTNKLLGRKV